MPRNVIGFKFQEDYLHKCAIDSKFSFGLIIGQPLSVSQIYIIHLAKNHEVESSDINNEDKSTGDSDNMTITNSAESIEDVKNTIVASHVVNVTKMIPGSFYVLGIFIVAETCIFDDVNDVQAAVHIIQDINTNLRRNKYLCGNCNILSRDKLILSYSKLTKKIVCQYYNAIDGNIEPTNIMFTNEKLVWHMFETNYEFDDVFPIVEGKEKISIEQHFKFTLESILTHLENSEYFLQNEPMNEAEYLESYLKYNQIEYQDKNTIKKFKVNVFMPTIPSVKDPIIVERYQGLIRFSGIVSSRIWTNSNKQFRDIQLYIRNDIIRSLASRIQIYCDGLIDTYANNDSIIVSEPPRRVFFNVPYLDGIQFSEYIFRGETPSVACAQAKYLLDIEIDPDSIDTTLEGLLDCDDMGALSSLIGSKQILVPKSHDYGRFMYMAGLGTAILILIISILLHFLLR